MNQRKDLRRNPRNNRKGPSRRASRRNQRYIQIGGIVVVFLLLLILVVFGISRCTGREPEAEVEDRVTEVYSQTSLEDQEVEVVPREVPWYLAIINEGNPLDAGFRPELGQLTYGHFVDIRILEATQQLLSSAENAGIELRIAASFRDYETQKNLFDYHMGNWVNQGYGFFDSFQKTRQSVAPPGSSEHQAGLAIDLVPFGDAIPSEEMSLTPEIRWLVENAYSYGFIMRYPYGTTHITGVVYEPWHWRYVGLEAAREITNRGITLEEYLLEHFGVPF